MTPDNRKTPDEIEEYREQLIYANKHGNELAIFSEIQRCQLDRWHFLSHWCKTINEHHPMNPIQLIPNKTYLEYVSDFDYSDQGYLAAYFKSRQILISWLFTCFAVHETCLLTGQKVFIQRLNESSAKDLIERAMVVINNLPLFLKPRDLKTTLTSIASKEMMSEFTALPKGAAQIVGKTGTRVVVDECQDNDELDATFRKVRPALDSATGTPGRLSFIGTPEVGYWLQLVEDQNDPEEGGYRGKSKIKHPMRGVETWQNRYNKINVCQVHIFADPEKDPDRDGRKWYDHIVATTPRKNFAKEYNLDARSEAGDLIYPEFDPNIHWVDPFPIPLTDRSKCTLSMILDHGTQAETAALWLAAMADGQIIAYREHYVAEKGIDWHADRIRELEGWKPRDPNNPQEATADWESIKNQKRTRWVEPIHVRVIDPSTNKTTVIGRPTVMQYYNGARNQMGFKPGENAWLIGRDAVSRLFLAKLPDGRPKFVIFNTLKNLYKELTNYRTPKTKKATEVKSDDKPLKQADHLLDDLRMGVMTPPAMMFIPLEEYDEPVVDEAAFPYSPEIPRSQYAPEDQNTYRHHYEIPGNEYPRQTRYRRRTR